MDTLDDLKIKLEHQINEKTQFLKKFSDEEYVSSSAAAAFNERKVLKGVLGYIDEMMKNVRVQRITTMQYDDCDDLVPALSDLFDTFEVGDHVTVP